jgi:hypothetical protein
MANRKVWQAREDRHYGAAHRRGDETGMFNGFPKTRQQVDTITHAIDTYSAIPASLCDFVG